MKIKSWDDVDMALAQIATHQEAIAACKASVDERRAKIAELEPRIEAFVREREDELQERSKSLPHGRVWMRQATRLVAKSWAKVVDKLFGTAYEQCIRTKYEADKERLAELDDAVLKTFGVKRETSDAFGYEAS